MEWIKVEDRLPEKTGWYEIKDYSGFTSEAPLSKNMRGELVWVVPAPNNIVAWRNRPIKITDITRNP